MTFGNGGWPDLLLALLCCAPVVVFCELFIRVREKK